MFASVALFALAAITPAFAAPSAATFKLYTDGNNGSVIGTADTFDASYTASTRFSLGGCSSTAVINECYAIDALADSSANLATKDYQPFISGGQGKVQRSLLLSPTARNRNGTVTHTARFHISSSYTGVPTPGQANEVTFTGLRNSRSTFALKALDVRARTFTGEETSGPQLYVAVIGQSGSVAFPTAYPLAQAIGKTIEVTYTLGAGGQTVDANNVNVATVTAAFVGGEQLFSVSVTKTAYPNGVVDPNGHKLIFGAERAAVSGQKRLKVWVGDYTVASN